MTGAAVLKRGIRILGVPALIEVWPVSEDDSLLDASKRETTPSVGSLSILIFVVLDRNNATDTGLPLIVPASW